MLQCVAVAVCVAACCSVLQRVAACCSVLQCVAVCCSVLQWDFHVCVDDYINRDVDVLVPSTHVHRHV